MSLFDVSLKNPFQSDETPGTKKTGSGSAGNTLLIGFLVVALAVGAYLYFNRQR